MEGGKPRTVNMLDRFDIDYALCMYCGIVSRYAHLTLCSGPQSMNTRISNSGSLHDKDRLGEWMETVPDFLDYEAGSEQKLERSRGRAIWSLKIFRFLRNCRHFGIEDGDNS